MLRIEQGFPDSAYIDKRSDNDPLVLFASHIHHGRGRRRPDDAIVRVEKPSPEKVEASAEWSALREVLLPASSWDIEREEHPEWPQIAIWLAVRSISDTIAERLLYERLTILSYPSASKKQIEAFVEGDDVAQDLLVATSVVGALQKYLRE